MIARTITFDRFRNFCFGLFCLLLYCLCSGSSVFIGAAATDAHDYIEAIALGFIALVVFSVSIFWIKEAIGFFLSVFSSWRTKA